ncbi:MAG: hypothetical protein ACXVB9_22215 [Bdellovibrionota bacterium]
MFALILLLATSPAHAFTVKCGGNYAGEDLNFTVNPLNNVLTAKSASEAFSAYVDLTNPQRPHLLFGEVVKDAEWDKLQALRDAATDQDLQTLLSRLGSMNLTEMWLGWTPDGYFHIQSQQRERTFSLSCTKI